ncbi:MAG: C4-dicarboxylate TRAP transporter substrate-binding protein [Acuticoccus sp.]
MTRTMIAGALATCLMAGSALAQDYTLRFNHVLGPSEPYHEGFLAWADAVDKRTDGGLKIDVFHSSQLGVEEDIIEQLRQGANVGQNTDAARLGNYVPGIAVVNGPYFVNSIDEVAALTDSPTMQTWQDELADEHGLKVVCFDWVQGFRNFFLNKEVRAPGDLSGQRVRTPPAPIWQESIRSLGAAPVAMNFGDVYPGLQQRAIDGAELTYQNIVAGNLNEVLDVANETKHILLVNFQVVSSDWFNGLPEDYQTALVEECRTAGQATSRQIEAKQQEAKETLKAAGMTIVEDVDMDAFRTAGDAAYEALGIAEARATVQSDLKN